MKKILAVTIGILLSGVLLSQIPFEVEKELKIIGSDTTVFTSGVTHVGIKMTSSTNHIKLIIENRDLNIKIRTKKMFITEYKKPGGGIGGKRIYTCKDTNIGHIEIEEELSSMTGKVKFDRNKDGVYEEILVLK